MADALDLPDMDELARQMEDAMNEAQKVMQDLPMQTGDMENVMGSLSALVGGMPTQMGELGAAMTGLGEKHEANVASLAGEPDWSVEANIRVGEKLHLVVSAAFDLEKVREAWSSTQGVGFELFVEGAVAGTAGEMEAGLMDQIMGQLKKGRSIAVVEDVQVLACRIQGAPGDAAEKLQLSPEANIPLMMDEGGLGFEFAPLLTIRNRWESANIPTFSPLGKEIVVQLEHFESGEAFKLKFEPTGQEDNMTVELSFQPLALPLTTVNKSHN
ncbi:MAG: hypothetical protein DRJ03_05520 [Chloroflexi bacterium]|nr:MAG: hypothetical protein B6I35_02705 [Anaerolineaceae bacterium 4572_32.2]RLC82010.1 MAG: hypothetical protein DRI81_01000 [Chloroflexota bacterium]RLC87575.1 MAG: hypothetical protein DRJ03_05520 [Chloroflexota bacterium]HEY73270.1 hypothetical protein [Thermoflexia bacterium]